MKKVLTVILVLAMVLASAFAGDFKFLFTELDQHTELLSGFLPTLVTIGVGYNGLDLIEGDLTQLQFTFGGGYTQRALFQDPVTGEPLRANQLLYDCIQMRWNLKFLQGFGDSWVEGLDMLTAYAGYEGRYEKNIDSMVTGYDASRDKNRMRGFDTTAYPWTTRTTGATLVPTLNDWFGTSLAGNSIYPDLADDYVAFMTNFYVGLKLNAMDDEMVSNEGATAELKFQFAPGFANQKAKYYSVTFNGVAGTTLCELQSKKGENLFSIVLIDRLNVNWTDGEKVPVYASMPVSLGRKMRGFNTNSYNTNFTVVNNLDLRFAGPEPFMDGVFPRLNAFFDMGYYAGDYFNCNVSAADAAQAYDLKRFLCSCGFQLEMCFFDFIDLGFELSYLINGENLRNPGQRFITGATFFLDF